MQDQQNKCSPNVNCISRTAMCFGFCAVQPTQLTSECQSKGTVQKHQQAPAMNELTACRPYLQRVRTLSPREWHQPLLYTKLHDPNKRRLLANLIWLPMYGLTYQTWEVFQ